MELDSTAAPAVFDEEFNFFMEIEVTNIINLDPVLAGKPTPTALNDPFNMHNTLPQEGVHYSYPDTFGDPVDPRNNGLGDYQKPRELIIDAGFKF